MVSFCNFKDSGGSELLCGVINASPYRNLLGVDDFDALHHSAHSWLASRRYLTNTCRPLDVLLLGLYFWSRED
ncbi:hypothetical protein SAY87_008144 [Trapa incisa]|uniref:Uncharacterized protein n=1 Tax=Trapa incisa TaxID=236973 RepID=A0AAN7QFS1_9MYRT|nr:hypothetical protein SAY87_008144 [Trapa incisa]